MILKDRSSIGVLIVDRFIAGISNTGDMDKTGFEW